MIEFLEKRRLFSATLSAGVVSILATPGNDLVKVVFTPGGIEARVNDTLEGIWAQRKIIRFSITGFDGNDWIELSGIGAIDALIEGSAGDDTIFGGGGADILIGGNGRDRLFGGAGDDLLSGGANPDKLDGDRGVIVHPGSGPNFETVFEDVVGDHGNDTLYGGGGNDGLRGGAGADILSGGRGADLVDYSDTYYRTVATADGVADDGYYIEGTPLEGLGSVFVSEVSDISEADNIFRDVEFWVFLRGNPQPL